MNSLNLLRKKKKNLKQEKNEETLSDNLKKILKYRNPEREELYKNEERRNCQS